MRLHKETHLMNLIISLKNLTGHMLASNFNFSSKLQLEFNCQKLCGNITEHKINFFRTKKVTDYFFNDTTVTYGQTDL